MMDNAFAGLDIVIDEDFRERVETLVQLREGKSASALHQPFRRNVDIWFFAIMLAVKKGLKPTPPKGKTYKAAEGVVLGSDSWRPTALTLLAIAESGKAEIVDSPGEMMRIASSYAHAGLPLVFSMLDQRGDDTSLDYICDEVEDLVS
ncbi:hypothetical protein LCM18_06405 [Qipengyuania flava]|nr:hypothetical protein LCM18_06405 [Qipengyuania flava]